MSTSPTTTTVTSADGSTIAYSRSGSGPALILVDGALCWRAMGPSTSFAQALAPSFTVYAYDRRGRGDSTEAGPFAAAREIEDLAAVIDAAGGSAFVFGQSSGAALAADAAAQGLSIPKLALFEAPFVVDDTREPVPADIIQQLETLLAEGRNGAAVKLFMRNVGVPAFGIAMMQLMPVWKKLKSVAPTLPYDFAAIGPTQQGRPLPAGRWDGATMPTLVLDGGKSPAGMRNAQRSFAGALPNARYDTIPGQTHMLKAAAAAPVLREFFSA